MKSPLTGVWLALLAACLWAPSARAFPPAPNVLIYGQVVNQYGSPLVNPADQVILQASNGVQVVTTIQPGLAIGVNYALLVPMDSATIPGPFLANALTGGVPYKLYVSVGSVTNLPVEMAGAELPLPAPSQLLMQNLTLPGAGITSSSPTNTTNPFSVQIVSAHAGSATLSLTTAAGATYSVYGSTDLMHWTLLSFTIPANGPQTNTSYLASAVQSLLLQTVQPSNAPPMEFFRLQHQ